MWLEGEGDFDGAAGGDDAPALSVDLDAGEALGRVDEDALDLLRREVRVRLEHAGHGRGDDGRGERGAVNELVVLAYHVRLVELDGDELANQVGRERARLVDVAVNALVLLDER